LRPSGRLQAKSSPLNASPEGVDRMAYREGRASPRRITSAHREVLACRLRAQGHGFDHIAERCGYATANAAYIAVTSALKRLPQEPAEELRRQELDRLDRLQRIAWTRLEKLTKGDGLIRVGGKRSADALDPIPIILRIMERRAKLMGLDAPQQYRILEDEAERISKTTGKPVADILALASDIAAEQDAKYVGRS
jgi:hypothetical protein